MTALERPYWIEALFERRDGWDASVYPFNLPVVRSLDRLAFQLAFDIARVDFCIANLGQKRLIKVRGVAFDTETDSLDAMRANLVGLSLSVEPTQAAADPAPTRQR